MNIGHLQIDLVLREVRNNERRLHVGSRAFDILELLLNANGALVSKDEIMRAVWPKTIVEENSLQVHICALRKALGTDNDLIRTVTGRGYRLLQVPILKNDGNVGIHAQEIASSAGTTLTTIAQTKETSSRVSFNGELVGRDHQLEELLTAMRRRNVVTLVGTGGIGKTRLAREAARQASPEFPDGVVIVGLASVTNEKFALEAVAAALGVKMVGSVLTMETIVRALHGRRLLIVLDNCEHLIDAAARIALALSSASQVVLATSREPLRIPDEIAYPVPSLDVPGDNSDVEAVQIAPATRLFLVRVQDAKPEFLADERAMVLIGAICRSLDGIPLAIELAAARAATLGVETLSHQLGDHLRILTGGYRTAMPRHQTMRAALDWSYRLLTQLERALFRRLGTYIGGFTLEAVRFLAAAEGWNDKETCEAFSGLILKSMVSAQSTGPKRRYRLLETTRQYAIQLLDDNGERRSAATAHAEYLMAQFDDNRDNWTGSSDERRMVAFSSELDNVREALDWCLSPSGDGAVGVSLASATVPLFFDLSLVGECCNRAKHALHIQKESADSMVPTNAILRLETAMAAALVLTSGPIDQTRAAWSKVYSISVQIGDVEYEARALWGLWNSHQHAGEARDALIMAQRFCGLAGRTGNDTLRLFGLRIEGAALHYLGEQDAARERLERMLQTYDHSVHRWKTIGFRIDHGIVARATLARVLWIQGHEREAIELARATFADATAYDFEMITSYVLVEALIPISIMCNDFQTARHGISALRKQALSMSFHTWAVCCECYDKCVNMIVNPSATGITDLELAITRLRKTGFLSPLTLLLLQKCHVLMALDHPDDALAVINEALDHCDVTGEGWLYAELCRMKGMVLTLLGETMPSGEWLALALNTAQKHGAKTLEERAKNSIACWLDVRHGTPCRLQ
jgi:predicted ATPase/DNA-binding winged helix-turn-helix (wHTH) protein